MKKSLSISSANLLYLVSMLLVLFVGSFVQSLNLTLGLIATEFVLILLPAVVFLLIKKVPVRNGLRLNPIKPGIAVICFLLGVSAYVFSVLIESMMAKLSGLPSIDIPASAMPQGTLFYILYFFAIAITAPLCEEAIFRGAIQGAYESRKSAFFAIVLPMLMFVFYHFRFSGLPGLLPIAFLLGYVAWRTHSIIGSILIHFGMNGAAAIVTILALNGITIIKEFNNLVLVSAIGLLISLILLYFFIRMQARHTVEEEPSPEVTHRKWFFVYWPLMVAFVLYLFVVISPFLTTSSSQNSDVALSYSSPQIESPIESRYQAVNRTGDVVGEMECVVTPLEETFSLDCSEEIEAYEVRIDNSMWSDSGHTASLHVVWDSQTLEVLEYRNIGTYDAGGDQTSELINGNLVTTSFFDTYEPLPVAGNALLEYEWAWKVNDLDGTGGPLFKTPFVYLMRWDDNLKKSIPVIQDELLKLEGDETITVPAGEFNTWKVTLGGQTAWYMKDDPDYPRPIQFDNGMVVYSLVK